MKQPTHIKLPFQKTGPKNRPSGFTIIELMFATLIFSVIMLIMLGAFLQIGRMFYKGVAMARTQDATRSVVDNISDDIRFSKNPGALDNGTLVAGDQHFFCIKDHRYTYTLKKQVVAADQKEGIYREKFSSDSCPPLSIEPLGNGEEGTQMLGIDMQVNRFDYECKDEACYIRLHVIFYGDDKNVFTSTEPSELTTYSGQLWNAPSAECSGGFLSSQFCATSDLSTTVLERF